MKSIFGYVSLIGFIFLMIAAVLTGAGLGVVWNLATSGEPITYDEVLEFKGKIEEYAENGGYTVEYDENDSKTAENEQVVGGEITINKDSYISFELCGNSHFDFTICGLYDEDLWPLVYDLTEFTNSFSKYEITKQVLDEFYEDNSYKAGETAKDKSVDFWENARLSYSKGGIYDFGERYPPEFYYSNIYMQK
ncbi:MAG: hypothetical protein ACI396_08295 [Acutalibacteraceae bacterium]